MRYVYLPSVFVSAFGNFSDEFDSLRAAKNLLVTGVVEYGLDENLNAEDSGLGDGEGVAVGVADLSSNLLYETVLLGLLPYLV